jgi:hypothetical protein
MQMTRVTRFPRLVRTLAIGALAIGAATMALPGTAAAGSAAREISHKLDRIAYQVKSIPEIRGPRRQRAAIDRLQKRLYRLDRVNDHQRGRRARANDMRIERLQHRLNRMERRVAYRAGRRDSRYGDRRYDRRSDGRNFYRTGEYSDPSYDHLYGGKVEKLDGK